LDNSPIQGRRAWLINRAVPISVPCRIRSIGSPKPDGEIATTDMARPALAGSIATRSPRELALWVGT
jgi:hypothetical protein